MTKRAAPPLNDEPIVVDADAAMADAPAPRRLFWFVVSMLVLLSTMRTYRFVVIDDPWITFRYGRNLVSGHGLAFNPGDGPVEGYSNFLWMLWSAVVQAVGVDPLAGARLLSFAAAAAILWWLCTGVPGLRRGESRAPHGAVLLAAIPAFGVWTLGGMETLSYAFLLFAAVLASARCAVRPSSASCWALGACLAGAALSRPEGPIVFAAPVVAAVVAWRRPSRGMAAAVLGALGVFIAYTLWRLWVFGSIVPTTVSAKVGGSAFAAFVEGMRYLVGFLLGVPAIIAAIAALAAGRALARRLFRRPLAESDLVAAGCAALIAIQVVFVLGVGGDWMPGRRFWVPVLPMLCWLAGRELLLWPRFVRFVVVAFALVAGPFDARKETVQGYKFLEWGRVNAQGELLVEPLFRIGRDLRELTGPSDRIALTEVGVIPFAADRPVIDMLGLTEPEIAAIGGGLHRAFDAATVLRRAPEFILLAVHEDETHGIVGMFAPDTQMLENEDFQHGYREVRRWPRPYPLPRSTDSIDGFMILYERIGRGGG